MSNTNVKALTIVIIEFTVTLAKKKKLKKKKCDLCVVRTKYQTHLANCVAKQ